MVPPCREPSRGIASDTGSRQAYRDTLHPLSGNWRLMIALEAYAQELNGARTLLVSSQPSSRSKICMICHNSLVMNGLFKTTLIC